MAGRVTGGLVAWRRWTPAGWCVEAVVLGEGGRTRWLSTPVGSFASAEAAMRALYEEGVDPADLAAHLANAETPGAYRM